MKIALPLQFSFIATLVVLLISSNISGGYGQCLGDQKALLLKFKNSLTFDSSLSTKLVRWDQNTDCCQWPGVSCDQEGHVLVLELDNETISGGVENSSSLFDLMYLEKLNLAYNDLKSVQIPTEIYKLTNLIYLNLSDAGFVGQIPMELSRLTKLVSLDLSYNNLRIDIHGSNSTSSLFPQLEVLKLVSCELQNFPDLKNQSHMSELDLSDNNIKGKIPSWIWSVGNGGLKYLNLSCNLLESLEKPYNISTTLRVIDLHSNSKLTGQIPTSICNLHQLQLLDMSNNSINNRIPPCLFQKIHHLRVLNLGRNKLSGLIPDTFPRNCNLEILSLNNNMLEGKVSRSLNRCAYLEVFDIGNNKIRDTFPCMLKKLFNLHVLVLRSNMFYGNLKCPIANQTWPRLQIIDLASNNFNGYLLPQYFSNLEKMMPSSKFPEPEYLRVEVFNYGKYYLDRVTVVLKGREIEIVKLLAIFTSIDFSCNNFQGEIPEVLGDLKLLYLLNLSHNALTGRIPQALGKLTQLESLDLSVNQLSGRIPDELVGLTFLSFLNLSFNQLSGRIPRGNQFQTFSADSFEGNTGLCDFPLKKTCSDIKVNELSQPSSHSEHEIDGKYISFALGSSVCFGIVTWLLLYSQRYNELVDRLLFRILGQHKKSGRNKNKRRSR
ncbi:receptor-like protein 35 [Nicotiana tabacum]|uniref:Receptor-like protein 35 n=1 Tax=Nicotiana tabacum TaxID=4097 RepID=A0A1S3YXN2_TOBAC